MRIRRKNAPWLYSLAAVIISICFSLVACDSPLAAPAASISNLSATPAPTGTVNPSATPVPTGTPSANELKIVSISPAANGVDIPKNSSFKITFDKDLDAATLTTISLRTGDNAVTLTKSLQYGNPKLLNLYPSTLVGSTAYTLTIPTSVLATDGTALSSAAVYNYKVQIDGVPNFSVTEYGIGGSALASGTVVKSDLTISMTNSTTFTDGVLSALWSKDGTTWTEIPGTAGSNSFYKTLATADGDDIRIKGRYMQGGVARDTAVQEFFVDKQLPTMSAFDTSTPGQIIVTFSEPIYASKALAAATAGNFSISCSGYYASMLTLGMVTLSADNLHATISYTFNSANAQQITVYSSAVDHAGNGFASAVIIPDFTLLKKPEFAQFVISSPAKGSLTIKNVGTTAPVDTYLVAISTSENATPAVDDWRTNPLGTPQTFTGLDPETRYYFQVKTAISGIGETLPGAISPNNKYAYAYPLPVYTTGSGSITDPWLITSRAELEQMLDTPARQAGQFKLGADINLARYPWTTLGSVLASSSIAFTGGLDGAGYAIRAITVTNGYNQDIGLFTLLNNATVKNLAIDSFSFSSGWGCYIGALASRATGNTTISNIAVTDFSVSGVGPTVGGLVALVGTNGDPASAHVNISKCFVQGSVTSTNSTVSGNYASGLVGYSYNAIIKDCFTVVNLVSVGNSYNAGLVGKIEKSSIISNCFASGYVDAIRSGAGLIGSITSQMTAADRSQISSSVAMVQTVGKAGYAFSSPGRFRLLCLDSTAISYYATLTNVAAYSGMTIDGLTVTSADVRNGLDIGVTAFKTSTSSCFTGWDFANTWSMTINGPCLLSMPIGGGVYGIPSLDVVPWD